MIQTEYAIKKMLGVSGYKEPLKQGDRMMYIDNIPLKSIFVKNPLIIKPGYVLFFNKKQNNLYYLKYQNRDVVVDTKAFNSFFKRMD